MIQPDDIWTVKKIALCYRLADNYEKSLEFYLHADFLQPNKFSTQMQIANAYLLSGKIKESLKIYYKLAVENEDNVKVQRAIVWASFLAGNLGEAEYYSQKILAEEPSASDYLNAGHIAWCEKNRQKAVDFYRKSLELKQNNSADFELALKEDFGYLKANGVDSDELLLMIDAVLFN
jgi:tetratricopeptide (TPR) repeat protein